MWLREYKWTLIDKGLNYFIPVQLPILETIVLRDMTSREEGRINKLQTYKWMYGD